MCYYQEMIKNRKYVKNKTNKGIVPTLPDRRVEYVPTKCGNCRECRKQKSREWTARLTEHIKTHTNGKFITLTFSNQSISELLKYTIKRTDKQTGNIISIPMDNLRGYDRENQLATKAMRIFTEGWRYQFKNSPQHWMVTELGHNGTENIHLHGVIWTDEPIQTIRSLWPWGFILPKPWDKRPNYVNNQSITYWSKYISKIDQRNKEYKPIILCSPGIGKDFINSPQAQRIMQNQTEIYTTPTGHQMTLPTYWRNKLFTEADKETLWIKNLDKNERWVDGIKYDISKSEKDYKRAIQDARRTNAELRYGGRPNKDRKYHEEERRNTLLSQRTNNY